MQIEFNGQKEEAYSLTIYKTHAKAIASGEKTVEIRSYSNKNCEMFLDPKKLERNAKLEAEGNEGHFRHPFLRQRRSLLSRRAA